VNTEEASDVVDRTWLAAGHGDGSVSIWDLETEHCVTTLHSMVFAQYFSLALFPGPQTGVASCATLF
jgi:WD40 repeat protein